ncbi:hypothetical protein BpHYR1_026169 [Brachionus plicatilis]|uniref:Uncharacterized protein n=1 Tax=Brachionus plicatilis TaxID=10195 RepID=A0A3M7T7V2_BRAPC|nr:hypothetical protein BpHYR1_026169 [Brachionus plicatilis]
MINFPNLVRLKGIKPLETFLDFINFKLINKTGLMFYKLPLSMQVLDVLRYENHQSVQFVDDQNRTKHI